jgi:hypothetical protein
MRIEVVGADTFSQQERTYAEYSVFAALTRSGTADKVQQARVGLLQACGRAGDSVVCTVIVAVEGEAPIRIRATGRHACAAIDRAVSRIRAAPAAGPPDAKPLSP